ncbi:MAG: Maf family protein [Candidatus Zhuqueibacterota bacterium]
MAFLNTASIRIVLASQSPRRIELIKKVVSHFEVCTSSIDENDCSALAPIELVQTLATRKAEEVAKNIPEGIIIGADSVVVMNGQVLGKPIHAADSYKMLSMLSGARHQVYTGFSIITMPDHKIHSDYEVTDVRFRDLETSEIEKYIDSGQPRDKAGSYGIQDEGAVFVQSINGCYYNVMGLPVTKLYLALKRILTDRR